jgi:DNA-directed RNA polymerase alpha subunit
MKIETPDRETIDPNGLLSDKQHEVFALFSKIKHVDDVCDMLQITRDAPIRLATTWQMSLSVRCCNALHNARVFTKQQALAFIADGAKERNFGKKCLAELKEALNMPESHEDGFTWGITDDGKVRFKKGAIVSVSDLEKILSFVQKATN